MTSEVSFHPLADIFPTLAPKALSELADDIATHGLREPIVMHEGKILDGRNRFLACRMAGVEPRFKEFSDSGDPLAAVISLNLRRRHLDDDQRALVAAKIANLRRGHNQHTAIAGTSQAKAAEMLNVNESRVERIARVIKTGVPALVAALEQKEISASAAAKIAGLPADEQREIVAAGPAAAVEAAKEIRAPNSVAVDVRNEWPAPAHLEDDADSDAEEIDPEDPPFNFDDIAGHAVLDRMPEGDVVTLSTMIHRRGTIGRKLEVARWIWQYRQGVPLSHPECDEDGKVIKNRKADAAIAALAREVNLAEALTATDGMGQVAPLAVMAFCFWAISNKAKPAEVEAFFAGLIHRHFDVDKTNSFRQARALIDKQYNRAYSRLRNPNAIDATAEIILRTWTNCRSGVSKRITLTGKLPTLEDLAARGAE